MTVPRATYRLQLTEDFGFDAAAELAPYLARLGISHAYLSPILKARRGSLHGYDTVDHTEVNPELGGLDGFRRLAEELRRNGIGIVLDIVPNHMGVGGEENAQWLDVLEWGQQSRYADWFDVNWSASDPALRGKLLVPFLGSTYGEALGGGGLELRYDAAGGEFAVWAEKTHKLPVCPKSYDRILEAVPQAAGLACDFASLQGPGEAAVALREQLAALPAEPIAAAAAAISANPDRLDRIIAAQTWRPARYSVAADDINYRRFFIVSDLAAIRVERDDVFEHVHRLPFQLVEEGLVEGLRVDHIDGLYDPKAYCLRVREACPRPIYLVVEKILAPHETLPEEWQVDGTTGYEFATAVTQLLTDPTAETELTRIYEELVGTQPPVDEQERDTKLAIIDFEMAAELDALATRVHALAVKSRASVDITRNAIRTAIRQYVAALPVYRTYIDDEGLSGPDERNIGVAIATARRAAPQIDPAVFDFLERIVTGELCRRDPTYPQAQVREAARRIQQYTGPVMAKGLEDTALYRFNRLIALSDVGQKPDRFTRGVTTFHDFNRARQQSYPNAMLTTSSHDTKRGEDVRARIAALSGCSVEWGECVRGWIAILQEAGAPAIHPNDLYYFFQLLLGAWPTTLDLSSGRGCSESFRERMEGAMLKSVREARLRTNWAVPQSDYETEVAKLVETALTDRRFLDSFTAFEKRLGPLGAQKGLIELALKLTVPGVPDIYQGAEFWEQSMVDPDNRRPVDFDARRSALEEDASLQALTLNWRNGHIKQHVLAELLSLRRNHDELFATGSYEPLQAGYPDDSVVAFMRRTERAALLVAVRLYPWRARPWVRASIPLPDTPAGTEWRLHLGDWELPEAGHATTTFKDLPVLVSVAA